MPPKGYLALVLHAHLPFVRHPEHDRFLEEDWFFEAITECYLPLLEVFERLARDHIPFKLSLVLTPSLLAMLSDDLLCSRYRLHLEELIELAEREVVRTRQSQELQLLARMYLDRFRKTQQRFVEHHRGDLVSAFAEFDRSGHLELFTSAATHAYLPALQHYPLAVAAQIRTAIWSHRKLFGRAPRGFWLPECGYFEGLADQLAQSSVGYFILDTHGLLHANPGPSYGVYAPILCRPGLAAFGRDRSSSRQVWSAKEGYPGDPDYREFYRDIGFDLEHQDLGPHIQPTGDRKNTGIKYFRITGQTRNKKYYSQKKAIQKCDSHAKDFVQQRKLQIEKLWSETKGAGPPIVVSPYDAELFGHWWYEGPLFLENVFRKIDSEQSVFECITLGDYLERHPIHQVATPSPSSWGHNGYNEMWLNESNDWIYNHIHWASKEMIALAEKHGQARDLVERFLNQAARELMLAQSSDWAFIMKTQTMVPYAVRRTNEHLLAFRRLHEQIKACQLDEDFVSHLEQLHNIFPDMDFRCYRDDYRDQE
ncbi:MAG: DUF1957 domain-containing protein [Deltaproteobacteria bacterium]|nr:DUF1957 domain-containing protein [Deltaproteobacteria bacterium]